jgi:hypothetical protein
MKFGRTLLFGCVGLCLYGENPIRAADLRETTAITCPQGRSVRVQLRSTDRVPDAIGEARVERRGGVTQVEVAVAGMKPASLFGAE